MLLIVPIAAIMAALHVRKAQYILFMAGPVLYGIYLLFIGGDFMMGRHFTLSFFMSLICYMDIKNREFTELGRGASFNRKFVVVSAAAIIYTCVAYPITQQFTFGSTFGSSVSDERAGYFRTASLFNNLYSLVRNHELCIRNTWNENGVDELRDYNMPGGILESVPGITKYYNNDLYLNDLYALGDPYLTHLPAVKEAGWRIGHMWRQAPEGYSDMIKFSYTPNSISNEDAKQYYRIIDEITRGPLFDKDRIAKIIDINLGRYDYLIENYKATLDENGKQK